MKQKKEIIKKRRILCLYYGDEGGFVGRILNPY